MRDHKSCPTVISGVGVDVVEVIQQGGNALCKVTYYPRISHGRVLCPLDIFQTATVNEKFN